MTLKSLSLYGRDLADVHVDAHLGGAANAATITQLDCTDNALASLAWAAACPALRTLTADHNALASLASLPALAHLETLSVNSNRLEPPLAESVLAPRRALPALRALSLMKNGAEDVCGRRGEGLTRRRRGAVGLRPA